GPRWAELRCSRTREHTASVSACSVSSTFIAALLDPIVLAPEAQTRISLVHAATSAVAKLKGEGRKADASYGPRPGPTPAGPSPDGLLHYPGTPRTADTRHSAQAPAHRHRGRKPRARARALLDRERGVLAPARDREHAAAARLRAGEQRGAPRRSRRGRGHRAGARGPRR